MHARAASVDQAPGNAAEVATAPGSAPQRRAQEWNDAPEALGLLGRVQERALLWRWILEDRSREVLFEAGDRDGSYLEGYASYGTLLQVLGGSQHHSCLLLTSREAPPELPMLGSAHGAVRWLELGGLSVADARELLGDKRLQGDVADWDRLVTWYGDNGLALKVVGETVNQVFGGQINAFLEEAGAGAFGGFRRLLDRQLERLAANLTVPSKLLLASTWPSAVRATS